MPDDAVTNYLRAVRRVRRTGHATAEQSYYPAVFGLLDAVGHAGAVPRAALAHPAGVSGEFPDVALYEVASNVLTLPVEVKPAGTAMARLIASKQASDYARTFGGGAVLLTNLREWVLARRDDSGTLVEEARVSLVASEAELDLQAPSVRPAALRDLTMLVESGCLVRGNYGSPKTVASLLAYHARNMRDAVVAAGDPAELLSSIHGAMSKGLQIELESSMLTPTVVQTLVYGAFAAWLGVDDPQRFDWMQASYRLTVPVFAEILHEALRPALLRRCDLTGHLHAVGRVLSWTDRNAFVGAFDGDAIQYFYEPFLDEFDPALRDALGVWYTPHAIAEYQVARADHHVRTDLGVSAGLADNNVYLLDPACGTGTYLLAACDHIYHFHRNNGEPESVAAERTLNAMTTRLIGFEILPAAFIICHLHLGRYLHRLGAPTSDQRLRVYLTNSLTGWNGDGAPNGMTLFPELEEELHDAAIAKQRDPVLVVLGNPPYHGYSTAETVEERGMLQPWVAELWPTWGLRKHRLNDLYVRFWRIAIERIVTLTGRGVVSFITNRKWLGGRSYPSMRQAVVTNFQSIWIDDLHGSANDRTYPGDQSIFTTDIAAGIKVGTAIVTAVRTADSGRNGDVHRTDYRGSANDKRHELADRRAHDMEMGYMSVKSSAATRYRLVSDPADDYPGVDEYLPFYLSGVQPVRDEAVLATNRDELRRRMRDFFDTTKTLADLTAMHPGFGVQRARYHPERTRRSLLTNSSFDEKKIVRYLFRPFDTRWLYWETEAKLLNEARRQLLPYWRNVERQICIVTAQTPRRKGAARPVAGHAVGGFASMEPDARVFPLYAPLSQLLGEGSGELDFQHEDAKPSTTVAQEWVEAASLTLGLGDDMSAGEAIFFALVAVMQAPAWVEDQPVEMDDFPTVPLPAAPAVLAEAVTLGRDLTCLLDPDTEVDGVTSGVIRPNLRDIAVPDAVIGTQTIQYGRYGERAGQHDGADVLWNSMHGWRCVPEDVWAFSVGGFQVLPKWLSYRKNTGLTAADRETFRMLARRIQAILDLGDRCDSVYTAAQSQPLSVAAEPSGASIP